MEVINIYTPSGIAIPLISYEENRVVTEAKCTRVFQGEEYIKIEVESATQLEIPLYSYIDYKGERYRMNRPVELKQEWHNLYMYSIELESVRYELGRVLYDTSIDPTQEALEKVYSGGSFGNLYHFADMLVANLKRALGVTWRIEGADRNEKGGQLLSFERGENCLSALHKIAQSFHVFFFTSENVDTGERTLRFVSEYDYNPTPSAHWNIGDALFSVERKYVATDNIITRLWCFGSEEGAKKAGDRLTLPFKDMSDSYIEDPEKVRLYGLSEGVFIDEESKPSYTGSVSKTTDDHLTFHSSSWNMFSHLEDGATAKVHFETGGLQGMEFSVKRVGNGTITINPIKDKDLKLEYPSKDAGSPYRIGVGDTFKCIGIEYPFSVISDAQERLKISGTLHYNDVSVPKMEYSLTIREGYTTEAQVGDVVEIFDSYSNESVNLMIQQMETDLLSPLGECSVKVSNFRRKARVEEIFLSWKDRIRAILFDRSVFDQIYRGLSAESIIARVNTQDFRMSIKDILKGDKAFVEATKGLDGKSVSIEEARDAIISSEVFMGGISSSLKADEQFVRELKGRDGAPALINMVDFGNVAFRRQGTATTPYLLHSYQLERVLQIGEPITAVVKYRYTPRNNGKIYWYIGGNTMLRLSDTIGDIQVYKGKIVYETSSKLNLFVKGNSIGGDFGYIEIDWICLYDGYVTTPPLTYMLSKKQWGGLVSVDLSKDTSFTSKLASTITSDAAFVTATKGDKGETGAKGDRGERGLQGAKGEKGDKPVVSLNSDYKLVVDGVPSSLSLRGPQGIQGIQGLKGETGAKGDRGERGLQGAKGEKGDKPVISYAEGVLKVDGIGVHNFNQQFAEKANIVELNNYATKDALSKVETRAIRPSSANAVGSSTSNPFAPILNDPNGESKVISLDIVEGTDLYLPPARLCAVGTKIYLRGSTMSCPITPYHHSTTIRPIRIYANERDVYSSGCYYSSSNLIETFTNAEWRVDLECIVAGCGLKGWLWVNSVECKNLSEFTSSITTAIQSIAEAKQEINRLKNSVLRKGEGLQLGFFNLVNHNSGTYHVKATDYHILARRTGNGDNYPYIRVSESLPDGHEFIVDIPFNDCRVRFVMPPGGSTWGNGGTEWQSGYRYHVTKSHTKEWGVVKTAYAQ